MSANGDEISITIPPWVDALARAQRPLETLEDQMRLAIALATSNVERGGGPFGAAVFSGSTLVAAGVNCVLASGLSIAHAEIVALMRTQAIAGADPRHPLGPYTLVTSAEPCCQCFGALVWSGVDRLVCGATREDVEAIGFDEGPKPDRWDDVLRARGITVVEAVCRAEAAAPLALYAKSGGAIYGLRHPTLGTRGTPPP